MIAKDIRRAVFLDRDGCISPDEYGYLSNPDEYRLYPYTGEALRILSEMGFMLFVVTNQSGIARGYFKISDLKRVHARMRALLKAEGVRLTKVYFSPYFATGKVHPYNIEHEDRKPGLGMFRRARKEHYFLPGSSWMIGDRRTDIEFGKKAGLKTILLLTGNGSKEMLSGFSGWERKPDFMAENLLTAAKLIQMLEK